MKKINIKKILENIESDYEEVQERKKAWLIHPRKKKLRKGHIRVTKHGVEIVEPHLHDYPWKMEQKEATGKKKVKKESVETGIREKQDQVTESLNTILSCYA